MEAKKITALAHRLVNLEQNFKELLKSFNQLSISAKTMNDNQERMKTIIEVLVDRVSKEGDEGAESLNIDVKKELPSVSAVVGQLRVDDQGRPLMLQQQMQGQQMQGQPQRGFGNQQPNVFQNMQRMPQQQGQGLPQYQRPNYQHSNRPKIDN